MSTSKSIGMQDIWSDEEKPDQASSDPQLVVDVKGFEGPLDLLLSMARSQKLDLSSFSILELVEQYLKFIADMRRLRLELAADYLVMAAWLTYLKSRLLLPAAELDDDEPSGEELAEKLAFRLRRLEAMRDKGAALMHRNRLGRDFFARGAPEQIACHQLHQYEASTYELLSAYAGARERTSIKTHNVYKREVWSLGEAREILERLIGTVGHWSSLDGLILQFVQNPELRRSALASSFAAALELVREGRFELRQSKTYAPIELRSKAQNGEVQKVSV